MAAERPEVIEERIAATRRAMGDKVHNLSERTVHTVEEATQTVTDVIHAATGTLETVADAAGRIRGLANVESVGQIVKDTVGAIPFESSVRAQPWASVGAAAAAGFIAGWLTNRPQSIAPKAVGFAAPAAAAAERPSPFAKFLDQLGERFIQEVRVAAERTFTTVGDRVVEQVQSLVPGGPPPTRGYAANGVRG